MPNNLLPNILSDLRVELLDHFDKNFPRGGFFGKQWPKKRDGSPSHLIGTGTLRRSISAKVHGHSLTFTSSTPYSAIHNEGGTITVTAKMKKYFWAMFKKTDKKEYKYLALMKIGSKITIPQRQYLGAYPVIDKTINRAARRAIDDELKRIAQSAKR